MRVATLLKRSHPTQIHLKRYRPLQQRHGKDNAMMALKIDQNSFETGQFAGMNLDPLSDFEVRPRLAGNFRSDSQLNGFNLPILDWGWRSSAANYLKDSWS